VKAIEAGKIIEWIALAFEAGCDGFRLARWLQARGIEVHFIHSSSVAVSRFDRLDSAMVDGVPLHYLDAILRGTIEINP
jgi:transposase